MMRTLHEASGSIEAHLLKDLLAQEGVPAVICGECLEGGVGELPVAGLVRLMVEDEHYAIGRALVERWESASLRDFDTHAPEFRKDADGSRARTRSLRSRWIVAAAVAVACWLYGHAVEARPVHPASAPPFPIQAQSV